jgi:hypothetical protein
MKKANNFGLTNLSALSKLGFGLSPISNAERERRRQAAAKARKQANNRRQAARLKEAENAQRQSAARLRQAARRQSEKRAAARLIGSITARAPKQYKNALAHAIGPNGKIHYFIPEVPVGGNYWYNFSNPVPFRNLNAGEVAVKVRRR